MSKVVAWETHKLSIYFFITFTATSSFGSIVTHIYEQKQLDGIGPASLATTYFFYLISTMIAPSCKWKFKSQIIMCAFAEFIKLAAGLIVPLIDDVALKYVISCAGFAVSGITSGHMWVSQGGYMHLLLLQNKIPENEKGKYFSIFNIWYCLSNISAGLITTFCLGLFDDTIYFIFISVVGLLGIIYSIFVIKDIQVQELGHSIENGQNNNILYKMKEVCVEYPKMISVLFIIAIDGLLLGITSSEVTHLMPGWALNHQKKDFYAGICLISLGVGSVIGGHLSGLFGDRFSGIRAANFGLLFFLMFCLSAVICLYVESLYELSLVSSFILGFTLYYIEGWMYLAISRYFKGKLEAFSVNKQGHSIVYLLFQIMVLVTVNDIDLTLLFSCIAVLVVPAAILLQKIPGHFTTVNSEYMAFNVSEKTQNQEVFQTVQSYR